MPVRRRLPVAPPGCSPAWRWRAGAPPMYAAADAPGDPPLLRAGRRVLREIEPEQPNSYEILAALVRRLNVSETQASELMWQLSVDAIRRHPAAYLTGTIIQLGQLL